MKMKYFKQLVYNRLTEDESNESWNCNLKRDTPVNNQISFLFINNPVYLLTHLLKPLWNGQKWILIK